MKFSYSGKKRPHAFCRLTRVRNISLPISLLLFFFWISVWTWNKFLSHIFIRLYNWKGSVSLKLIYLLVANYTFLLLSYVRAQDILPRCYLGHQLFWPVGVSTLLLKLRLFTRLIFPLIPRDESPEGLLAGAYLENSKLGGRDTCQLYRYCLFCWELFKAIIRNFKRK